MPEPHVHPVDRMLACHEELRTWLDTANALARGERPAETLARSAAGLRQFFQAEMPLHQGDEDLSLAVRLRHRRAQDDVLQALEVMSRQHREIEGVVARVLPQWQALEAKPASLAQLAPRLLPASQRLQAMWEAHLALEETRIYPAARERLQGPDLEAMLSEMRDRRR